MSAANCRHQSRPADTAVTSFRDHVQQTGFSLPVREEGLEEGLEDVLRDIARKGKPHPWVVFAEYGASTGAGVQRTGKPKE